MGERMQQQFHDKAGEDGPAEVAPLVVKEIGSGLTEEEWCPWLDVSTFAKNYLRHRKNFGPGAFHFPTNSSMPVDQISFPNYIPNYIRRLH